MRLKASMPTFEALDLFQTGKSHIAGVMDDNDTVRPLCLLQAGLLNRFFAAFSWWAW